MQFCKITFYFIWLHHFQAIQYPRGVSVLCDCISLQLTMRRMHPTPASGSRNPSFKYLWSQKFYVKAKWSSWILSHTVIGICIILYKEVKKVNSISWQCQTTGSYIVCKTSEQWVVPQWSLCSHYKWIHLGCDAEGEKERRKLSVEMLLFKIWWGQLKNQVPPARHITAVTRARSWEAGGSPEGAEENTWLWTGRNSSQWNSAMLNH